MTRPAPIEGGFPRAVLLDLDNTIFDHTRTGRAAIARIRANTPYLRRVPLDELWENYVIVLADTHREVLRGRMTGVEARDERWWRLANRYGGPVSRASARSLARQYRTEYLAGERAVPGALDLLRRIHPVSTVVVVTNHQAAEQERKLRVLAARGLVDHLVASAEVRAEKPSRRIFRLALRRARAAPDEAVMIGDSWDEDVRGALGAGVRPIWLNRFHRPRPAGPPVDEIDSLRPTARVLRLIAGRPRAARIISRPPVQPR